MKQAQYSLREQLEELVELANWGGYNDAADWIISNLSHLDNHSKCAMDDFILDQHKARAYMATSPSECFTFHTYNPMLSSTPLENFFPKKAENKSA